MRARVEGQDDGRAAIAHAETMMPRLEFGWSDLVMMRDARFKFIRAPRSELYDLKNDPAERHDLAAADAERAAEMSGQLQAWTGATADAAAGAASTRKLDPDEEARLRSLGCLGGDAFKSGSGPTGPAVDPKDGIAEVRWTRRAGSWTPGTRRGRLAPSRRSSPPTREITRRASRRSSR